jgi:hypothetical protein
MKTYRRFYLHLERNSLKIYNREKCFGQTSQRKMKHAFYGRYTFSIYLKVFEIIKSKGKKVTEFCAKCKYPVVITRM